jgi:hypothetical protein
MKREACAWGHNGTTLSLGDINTEIWSLGWGLDARLTTLLCKKTVAAICKEVKTGFRLAESSKEGYVSKKGCFAIDDDDALFM